VHIEEMERQVRATIDLFEKETQLWKKMEEDQQPGPTVGPRRRKDKHNYPRPQAEVEDNADH
jgi:hypothetical protein